MTNRNRSYRRRLGTLLGLIFITSWLVGAAVPLPAPATSAVSPSVPGLAASGGPGATVPLALPVRGLDPAPGALKGSPSGVNAFARLQPNPVLTATVGTKFTLELFINSGTNIIVGQQSYLTFTTTLLQVVNTNQPGCVSSTTVTPDTTTFEVPLQNVVNNSTGEIAYASGTFGAGAPPASDFRVAQISFCPNAAGDAVIHWQFSPPAPANRNSKITDLNSNTVSNPTLYVDDTIHITAINPTATVTPSTTPSTTPSNTPTLTATPTSTPSRTPTQTSTSTSIPTNTPSVTPSNTSTNTPTSTAIPTNTPTLTTTSTSIPSNTTTQTSTSTSTATTTPSSTPSTTPTRTVTNSATSTTTSTATNTVTSTPSSTSTAIPSNTPTQTATSTSIPTNTPTQTSTTTNTATATPSITSTSTPTRTATNTATQTATSTSIPTNTPTLTPSQTPSTTSTSTTTPTRTPTASATLTPTTSPTNTSTSTPSTTPSATLTTIPTNTPTSTPSHTATNTPIPTITPTQTATSTSTTTTIPTGTPSQIPSSTSTPTVTASATPSITSTNTPTSFPTNTPTNIPSVTASITRTSTTTSTPTPSHTGTPTRTASRTPTTMPSLTTTYTPTAIPSSTPPGTVTYTPEATQTSIVPSATATLTATPTVLETAIASATPSVQPTSCTFQFTDVAPNSTFYIYIRCLACRNIVSGYADGTFRPGNDITRGQIAKIVSNAAGFQEDPGPQLYEDVNLNNPFYVWINRLSNRSLMGGYPCGTIPQEPCSPPENRPYFRPFANATRGQLSKIVSNAAGLGGAPTGLFYTDVPEDNPFYVWIMRLTEAGVIGGYECGGPGEPCDDQNRPYFRPFTNVTRGQSSKIVANTFFPDCQTPQR